MVLKLPEEMTITGAAALKASLAAALAATDEVQLDAEAVRAVDLTGLQVLAAAQRTAARTGVRLMFALRGRSDVVDQTAATLGFMKPAGEQPGWLWEERLHA